jgi:hypothetical protein
MIRFHHGVRVSRKNIINIFSRLKIVSCVSQKFITICRMFERAQGTKFVVAKYLDSPPFMS